MQKVQDAIDAIDAIGEIGEPVTQDNRDAVATAEAKLALVDSKDTDKVTNADKLDAAKAAIAAYDARMQKVQDAIDAIDAIGTIEDPVTDENRQAVADAEAKVALVEEGDRDLITNADVLEAAKAAIAKNDKRAEDVAAVTEMINTLPEIKYPLTEDMRTAIAAAKTAYGALDEIGKGRVENYTVLEEAEELVQLFDNLGNVDNEGVVTASDAQFVMQFVVKSAQLSDWQKQVADVNNDSKVNSIDALLILRYSKGMITEFPYNS